MTVPSEPPGQLDIPLVWERKPGAEPPPPARPASAPSLTPFGGAWRLWLAALIDGGITALVAGAFLGLAGWLVAGLTAAQAAVTVAAGLETASVVAVGCLWGWRTTPGMLLVGVCFARPIAWSHVCRLWAVWLAVLPLLGLPLLFRHRGECVAERLAGGPLTLRPLPGVA